MWEDVVELLTQPKLCGQTFKYSSYKDIHKRFYSFAGRHIVIIIIVTLSKSLTVLFWLSLIND